MDDRVDPICLLGIWRAALALWKFRFQTFNFAPKSGAMSEMPLRMWLLPLPQLLITYYIIYVYYTDVLTWSLFPFCGSGWCQRFCRWWPTAQPIRNENGRCLCWQRKGWKPWRTCFSRTREKPWLGRSLWKPAAPEAESGYPKEKRDGRSAAGSRVLVSW